MTSPMLNQKIPSLRACNPPKRTLNQITYERHRSEDRDFAILATRRRDRNKKGNGDNRSKNGQPSVGCVSAREPGREGRRLWKFYRHNLRPRERQVGRRHRRQALSTRRSKRRGLYWRLRFSYGRISQYLQLRTEYRP